MPVKNKQGTRDTTTQEVDRLAMNHIETALIKVFQTTAKEIRGNQVHNERTIDFIADIQDTTASIPNDIYKPDVSHAIHVQCKGKSKSIKPNVRGPYTGSIRYQIKKAETIQHLLNNPHITSYIFLVDLINSTIYYLSIPLKYESLVDETNAKIERHNSGIVTTTSITLTFDPANQIYRKGVVRKQEVARFLNNLKHSEDVLHQRHISTNEKPITLAVNREASLLSQLNEYFTKKLGSLRIINRNELFRHELFALDNERARIDSYTLRTPNRELYSLFKSIDFDENGKVRSWDKFLASGVEEPEEVISSILRHLNRHLIHYIQATATNEYVNIHLSKEECDCTDCRFNRGEFGVIELESFSDLQIDGQHQSLDECHALYRFGRVTEAADLLLEQWDRPDCTFEDRIRLAYNIENIKSRLRFNSKLEDVKRLTLLFPEVTLLSIHASDKTSYNKMTSRALINKHFAYRAHRVLQSILRRIQDEHALFERGGWTTKRQINELTLEYFQAFNFCYFNRIFELDTEIGYDISETLLEALFLDYKRQILDPQLNPEINEWYLIRAAFYLPSDRVERCLKKLDVDFIQTNRSNSKSELAKILVNALESTIEFSEDYLNSSPHLSPSSTRMINWIISNLIKLLANVQICESDVNDIAQGLIKYVNSNSTFRRSAMELFLQFLKKHSNSIHPSVVQDVLSLIPHTKQLHKRRNLRTLQEIVTDHQKIKDSSVTSHAISSMLAYFGENCTICNHPHSSDLLPELHELTGCLEVRHRIATEIHARLKSAADWDLFYLAFLYDIIRPTSSQLSDYKAAVIPTEGSVPRPTFNPVENDPKFQRLDDCLNLVFKGSLSLANCEIIRIRNISDYYDWLIEPSEFNFSGFKIEWINHYPTRFYLKHIAIHQSSIQAIQQHLAANSNSNLQLAYFSMLLD